MREKYDLIVIGAGPGGYVAAIRAAQLGLRVAVVEKDALGGVCLNWGCIPTKALLRSAEVFASIKNMHRLGIKVEQASFDWPEIVKRSRQIAARASKGIEYLFKKNNVTSISGTARIVAPHQIEVQPAAGEILLHAENILIATGARPRAIPGLAFDGMRIISSKEAMILPEIPESIVIIGAGAIGVEFAYIFNALGARVTLVEMLPQILPIEDLEISETLQKSFKKQKIQTLTSTRVEHVEIVADGVRVQVSQDEAKQTLAADLALVAIGVQANVEGLGLEAIGVELNKGWIQVAENYRTNITGIYAIGDVAGPPWLAHVASAEGIRAVEGIAGLASPPVNYQNIPGCTYCHPQVASLGLTEQAAREGGFEIKVGRYPFLAHGKALALGDNEGFIKLIFNAKNNQLLGAHLIGPEVTELLAELSLAKTMNATIPDFLHTIHAHPTLSEGILEAAAAAAGEAIHI
jgi:dihydrolipoamide dehydrogenase